MKKTYIFCRRMNDILRIQKRCVIHSCFNKKRSEVWMCKIGYNNLNQYNFYAEKHSRV